MALLRQQLGFIRSKKRSDHLDPLCVSA